jgi:uncharacterized protein YjbJ (UPF0337 family)
MRALPWMIAGVGIGVGVTLLMKLNEPEPDYATGSEGVERAAAKSFGWGTRKRAEGKVGSVVGAVKEGVGRFTGDTKMEGEGAVERAAGEVKEAAGEVGQAVGQTIHDLNQ